MAQVTGGSDYDFIWDEKIEESNLILQKYSDSVVANVPGADSADQIDHIIATITRIFSQYYPMIGSPRRRTLREWREIIQPIPHELRGLKQNAAEPELELVKLRLRTLMTNAVETWKAGDPEIPRTRLVLNRMVAILFKHKFIKNPPRPEVKE